MSPPVIGLVALLVLSIGWVAGRRYEQAARSWTDYRTTRALLPQLLSTARVLSLRAAGVVLLAAVIAVSALYLIATEGTR